MRSLSELMNLEGRSALITGGSGHIGSAVCEALVELGADVTLLDLQSESNNLQCDQSLHSKSVSMVCCDLKDEAATRSAVREVISSVGSLDIIVHCAACVGTTQAPGWAVPFQDQSVFGFKFIKALCLS